MCQRSTLSLPFPLGSRPLQAHNTFSLHFFQPLSPKHNPEVAYIPGERNMSMCSFYLLIKLLKCEIIVESHAVVKKINKEHQCALHSVPPPPMVISCENIVQHHNSDMDMDTVKIQKFPSQRSLLLPFYGYILILLKPRLLLNPWQLLICSPFLSCSHFKNGK